MISYALRLIDLYPLLPPIEPGSLLDILVVVAVDRSDIFVVDAVTQAISEVIVQYPQNQLLEYDQTDPKVSVHFVEIAGQYIYVGVLPVEIHVDHEHLLPVLVDG